MYNKRNLVSLLIQPLRRYSAALFTGFGISCCTGVLFKPGEDDLLANERRKDERKRKVMPLLDKRGNRLRWTRDLTWQLSNAIVV